MRLLLAFMKIYTQIRHTCQVWLLMNNFGTRNVRQTGYLKEVAKPVYDKFFAFTNCYSSGFQLCWKFYFLSNHIVFFACLLLSYYATFFSFKLFCYTLVLSFSASQRQFKKKIKSVFWIQSWIMIFIPRWLIIDVLIQVFFWA